jgi:hypothetical protein
MLKTKRILLPVPPGRRCRQAEAGARRGDDTRSKSTPGTARSKRRKQAETSIELEINQKVS